MVEHGICHFDAPLPHQPLCNQKVPIRPLVRIGYPRLIEQQAISRRRFVPHGYEHVGGSLTTCSATD